MGWRCDITWLSGCGDKPEGRNWLAPGIAQAHSRCLVSLEQMANQSLGKAHVDVINSPILVSAELWHMLPN